MVQFFHIFIYIAILRKIINFFLIFLQCYVFLTKCTLFLTCMSSLLTKRAKLSDKNNQKREKLTMYNREVCFLFIPQWTVKQVWNKCVVQIKQNTFNRKYFTVLSEWIKVAIIFSIFFSELTALIFHSSSMAAVTKSLTILSDKLHTYNMAIEKTKLTWPFFSYPRPFNVLFLFPFLLVIFIYLWHHSVLFVRCTKLFYTLYVYKCFFFTPFLVMQTISFYTVWYLSKRNTKSIKRTNGAFMRL